MSVRWRNGWRRSRTLKVFNEVGSQRRSIIGRRPRWAVFFSGGGSTLQALLDQQEYMDIKLVVTNRRLAYGRCRARRWGVAEFLLEKSVSLQDLQARLNFMRIDAIFLAGYMKILPSDFVQLWKGRLFNIHPSLLPAYKGLSAFERAVADGNDVGVTVHRVTAEVDEGEILKQRLSVRQSSGKPEEFQRTLLRRTEQALLRDFSVWGSAYV
jgi:phosphoribosylglycinamide formyltransferase 1